MSRYSGCHWMARRSPLPPSPLAVLEAAVAAYSRFYPGPTAASQAEQRRQRREAADPATTTKRLAVLMEHRADQVLANPAWQLACVAEPGLLASLTDDQLAGACTSAQADAGLLASVGHLYSGNRGAGREVGWLLASHADTPRSAFENIISSWKQERIGTPVQEVALQRLRDPQSTLRGWRDAVPLAILCERSLSTPRTMGQQWSLLCGLLTAGHVPADAPLLDVIAMRCRTDVRERLMEYLPPDCPHARALREFGAYVKVGLHYRMRTIDYTLRAVIRRWEGIGALGHAPDRCARTVFTTNRLEDPWASKCRAHVQRWTERGAELAAEYRSRSRMAWELATDGPPAFRALESRARVADTAGRGLEVNHLAVLSSDQCSVESLMIAARAQSWFVRLCVAANRVTDAAVLQPLANDPHWIVRGAALESLAARAAIEVKP